jgi:hypothetical protein
MLAILISAAMAQVTAPSTSNGPVQVVGPQQPRRICRIERETGSHMGGRRICQTSQERNQEREQAQRTMAENIDRDWERRQVDRLNELPTTGWVPNGITGIAPTRGPR